MPMALQVFGGKPNPTRGRAADVTTDSPMAKKRSKTSPRKPAGARKAPGAAAAATGGSKSRSGGRAYPEVSVNATGKHLVIVESPTKAKTINKYLGRDFVVLASVGHVRDLPKSAPKGSKRADHPVPGVDLAHDFTPTYEIMPDKKKTVAQLRKVAKAASDVWFATDLDREGEAIAWHLAQTLEIAPRDAKRVVFNAITKTEITQAFDHPRPIDENKVNAQQARRILDRIVGYQVSPLLWKKVAGGLSAGRVQSVATRLVVDREREIEAFMPEEYWRIAGYFTVALAKAQKISQQWREFLGDGISNDDASGDDGSTSAGGANGDDGANGASGATPGAAGAPAIAASGKSLRDKLAWLAKHESLRAELTEIDGKAFDAKDRDSALAAAKSLGFVLDDRVERQDPKAKGPATELVTFRGHLQDAPDFAVRSIQTKRTSTRPYAPFITSTLQQQASNQLGFALQRTMRIAQQLYEGVDVGGDLGQTGLITYMRTDSTHLSGEALRMVRDYIGREFPPAYLPEKPNFFASKSNAQEAHEAIRPTDVSLSPSRVRHALSDEQFKLYDLIWKRFVASQMPPAQWDSTTVLIEAQAPHSHAGLRSSAGNAPQSNGPWAVFKATGRILVFDGFYKVVGLPTASDEAMLPQLAEAQPLAPLQIDPTQHFTSPPPRYTEASLQKKLEEEGIGRPSTYAAIIGTIQDRKYVQPLLPRDRRLMATDLGKVVTDKLIEGFPEIMDLAYTRSMEEELDKIEEEHHDWVSMLKQFYGPFKNRLDHALEEMTHAKAQTEPAPYKCPQCGAATEYRFGKSGRFLSCTRYPDCKYAAPIDVQGQPVGAEVTDIVCPVDQSRMVKRSGRFGPFLSSENYPEVKFILNLDKKGGIKLPKVPALATEEKCPKCDAPLNMRRSKRGPWLSCSRFPKCRGRAAWTALDEARQAVLEAALEKHEKENPQPMIKTRDGRVVEEGYAPAIITEESDQMPEKIG